MKEDKENTKPKERRGELSGLEDGDKPERVKEKKEVMSKVRRRLRPCQSHGGNDMSGQ